MAPVDEVPGLVHHYLGHEEERERIVEEGHRFALTEATMERSIDRILGICAQRMREREEGAIVQAAVDPGRA
jgi:spore maturation protein CgeB